jgi:transposase
LQQGAGPADLVERFCDTIKQCRRVAIGYDELAANYPAFIKFGSSELAAC